MGVSYFLLLPLCLGGYRSLYRASFAASFSVIGFAIALPKLYLTNGFVPGVKFIKVTLFEGHKNSQYWAKGLYFTFWFTGMFSICSGLSGL